MPPQSELLVTGGLQYRWSADAFLSRSEAKYALAQLWRLVGGGDENPLPWRVQFPVVRRADVLQVFALAPGELQWRSVEHFLPAVGSPGPSWEGEELPMLVLRREGPPANSYAGQETFPLDLVAATFLGLSRWEEIARPGPLDAHGRYLSRNSLAVRQGFVDRPVLDEWALVVGAWLRQKVEAWEPQRPRFRFWLTHDLDHPRAFRTVRHWARKVGGKMIRGAAWGETVGFAIEGLRSRYRSQTDPYVRATREQMTFAERLGCAAAFNVMTATRRSKYDDGYDPRHPSIRTVLDEICERGHELGWHPSYLAASSERVFAREKRRMDSLVGGSSYGGRHHYLRWVAGHSWEHWEDSGLEYDSSVAYADLVGFRCWTASPFQCFSIGRQSQLSLRERCPIVMDTSLIGTQEPLETMMRQVESVIGRCRRVGGEATMILHNTNVELSSHLALRDQIERGFRAESV